MSDSLIALLMALGTGVLFCAIGGVYAAAVRIHRPVIARNVLRAGVVVSAIAFLIVQLILRVLDTAV